MKPLLRATLAAALCAFVSPPVSAQNAAPKPQTQPFSSLGQAESVDATAGTVSMRRAELQPGQQLAQNDLVAFELSPTFRADRLEHAVAANDLKIGDTVFLLKPNKDGTPRATPPQLPVAGWTNWSRYSFTLTWLKVVSLSPLTLRRGVLPDGASFENGRKTRFSAGIGSDFIGTRWLGIGGETVTRGTALQLDARGQVKNVPTVSTRFTTETIQITSPDGLRFDRYTPTNLSEIAADLAADKILMRATLRPSPDGKQRVNLLLVRDKN